VHRKFLYRLDMGSLHPWAVLVAINHQTWDIRALEFLLPVLRALRRVWAKWALVVQDKLLRNRNNLLHDLWR
jgi:hypothetical protein